jgi:hypothetical protein
MSSRSASSKTHCFLEILSLLTLVFPLIDAVGQVPTEPFGLLFLVRTVAVFLVGLGLLFRPSRTLSCVTILIA